MEKKYRIKRLHSSKFIKLNNVSIYKDTWNSSCSSGEFNRLVNNCRQKFNINLAKDAIIGGAIDSPFNKRLISSRDIVVISNKRSDSDLNFYVSSNLDHFYCFGGKEGTLTLDIVLSVLTKYKLLYPKSSLEFFSQLNEKNQNLRDIFITIPQNREEYLILVKAFTEISNAFKVLVGYDRCLINIIVPDATSLRQKEYSFSVSASLAVFLSQLGLNKVTMALIKSMTKNNVYSSDVEDRLLKWAGNKDDLMVINLGDSSFYTNYSYYDQHKSVKRKVLKEGNSKDPRSITDYLKIALMNKKDLVVYSDANSTCVLAHELGHYIVSKKKFIKKLQNGALWRLLSRSDLFISFVGILLGLSGHVVESILTTIFLKSPVLLTEFAASYYGLKLMKELGCSNEDIKKARSDFRKAYWTYINGTIGISLYGVGAGNLEKSINLPTVLPDLI